MVYQHAYAEHLAGSAGDCRDRERHALDHALRLLAKAEAAGPKSPAAAEALDFAGRLWNLFIQDLVDPENDLPNVLKADLISIGIWVIKETALIRSGESRNLRGLIEICEIIRDGLK